MTRKRRKKGPRIVEDITLGCFFIIKGENGSRRILGKRGWIQDPGKDRGKRLEQLKDYSNYAAAEPDLENLIACYSKKNK